MWFLRLKIKTEGKLIRLLILILCVFLNHESRLPFVISEFYIDSYFKYCKGF